jgi:hypothetical protein
LNIAWPNRLNSQARFTHGHMFARKENVALLKTKDVKTRKYAFGTCRVCLSEEWGVIIFSLLTFFNLVCGIE